MVNRLCFILLTYILFISCETVDNVLPHEDRTYDSIITEYQKAGAFSDLHNLTVGIFGGSYARIKESKVVFEAWNKVFDFKKIINYSHGGHGFSKEQGSIQEQAQSCESCDVYIIWASTNDIRHNRKCGEPQDYTIYDNYNEEKLSTQCGGINHVLQILQQKNPQAKIFFISSCPFFEVPCGYSKELTETKTNIADYILGQFLVCKNSNIPFLNVLEKELFTIENHYNYFQDDLIHLNEEGYKLMALLTIPFFLDSE